MPFLRLLQEITFTVSCQVIKILRRNSVMTLPKPTLQQWQRTQRVKWIHASAKTTSVRWLQSVSAVDQWQNTYVEVDICLFPNHYHSGIRFNLKGRNGFMPLLNLHLQSYYNQLQLWRSGKEQRDKWIYAFYKTLTAIWLVIEQENTGWYGFMPYPKLFLKRLLWSQLSSNEREYSEK